MSRGKIALGKIPLPQDRGGQQLWRTTTTVKQRILPEPYLTDTKHGPVEFHIEDSVRRFLKFTDTARQVKSALIGGRLQGLRLWHWEQDCEAVGGAVHGQHNPFELIPIMQGSTVWRQRVRQLGSGKSCQT